MDVSLNIRTQPTKDQAMQASQLKLRANQNSKELSQHMQAQEAVIMWIDQRKVESFKKSMLSMNKKWE